MSQGGGFDFNQLAQSMGLGRQSSGDGDDANEKDMIESLAETIASKAVNLPSKVGVPLDNAALLNTGVVKSADSPGLLGSPINKAAESFSLKGGFLARTLGALLKRGEITDHTGGVGGEVHSGDGGGGGSGGGGDASGGDYSGGGGSYSDAGGSMADFGGGGNYHGGEVAMVDYGGHRYEVESMPIEAVGRLSPPNVGAIGVDLGEGHGVG